MIVSVTERGTFRRCRLLWDYTSRSRQNLTPIRVPRALSFGSLIHRAHELVLLTPDKVTDDKSSDEIKYRNATLRAVIESQDEFKKNYKKSIGTDPHPQEMEVLNDDAVLALAMMENYRKKWGTAIPEGMTLVAPEQTIIVPIPGTAHVHDLNEIHDPRHAEGQCAQGTEHTPLGHALTWYHQLEATLDGLMKDEEGRVWIFEHKTFARHQSKEVLDMNDQFIAYMWIITQIPEIGPLGGMVYDGMWKKANDSLDRLFERHLLTRAPQEIANFGRDLALEVTDMAAPNIGIYRNRRFEGCWDCKAFAPLCIAEFRGEDADWLKQNYFIQRETSEWSKQESPLTDE